MKPQRVNLCTTIRNALVKAGYSTVAVCNAINAQFSNLELKSVAEAVTKDSSVNTKTGTFRVSVDLGTESYKGKDNVVTRFDAFNSSIAKAEKGLAGCDFVLELPHQFIAWLDKLGKPTMKDEKATESANKVAA